MCNLSTFKTTKCVARSKETYTDLLCICSHVSSDLFLFTLQRDEEEDKEEEIVKLYPKYTYRTAYSRSDVLVHEKWYSVNGNGEEDTCIHRLLQKIVQFIFTSSASFFRIVKKNITLNRFITLAVLCQIHEIWMLICSTNLTTCMAIFVVWIFQWQKYININKHHKPFQCVCVCVCSAIVHCEQCQWQQASSSCLGTQPGAYACLLLCVFWKRQR